MSRRSFLAAGAGLVVASACGGGSSKNGGTIKTTGDIQAFPGSFLVVSGVDQRFVVGLVDKDGHVVTGADVRVAFGRDTSELRAAPLQAATFHADGIPTKPYYET